MEALHQHGEKTQKQIKQLEHNTKLVAHAIVLSQMGETKSKSMIENIRKELQDLKTAVQTSNVWQVCSDRFIRKKKRKKKRHVCFW
jgi:septal ring factor EnvC (AmiA/AmiB activator)